MDQPSVSDMSITLDGHTQQPPGARCTITIPLAAGNINVSFMNNNNKVNIKFPTCLSTALFRGIGTRR
jgi:hypothetical protein